jgi:hypothetical protein
MRGKMGALLRNNSEIRSNHSKIRRQRDLADGNPRDADNTWIPAIDNRIAEI